MSMVEKQKQTVLSGRLLRLAARRTITPSFLSASSDAHVENENNGTNNEENNISGEEKKINMTQQDALLASVQTATDSSLYYSTSLSPSEERRSIDDEERQYRIVDEKSRYWWQSLNPGPLVRKLYKSSGRNSVPGSLILLRCGESEWTHAGKFTGWADPKLTDRGVREVEHAGRLLLSEGYDPDVVFTSRLSRAVKSTWTIISALGAPFLPVYKSWRLNERHYGALTGLKKFEAAEVLGAEAVQAWRNSLRASPPPMKKDDPYFPGNDRRYNDLSEDQIPLSESLADCMERTRPLWEYGIARELREGNNVMVMAHTNTLRGLMKVIDGIGDEEIQEVSMPSGIPFVYKVGFECLIFVFTWFLSPPCADSLPDVSTTDSVISIIFITMRIMT